jgi:hypothetical protein
MTANQSKLFDKRMTRGQIKEQRKEETFNKVWDEDERDFLIELHKDLENNEALRDESFYGVYHFLARQHASSSESRLAVPIILVIKNIKNFPPAVLNDLIHLINKYRQEPYELKLNLMIGV